MIFKITTRLKIFIFILCMGIPNVAQEVIEEKVDVINIEVPVRVVYRGKLLSGLKKGDFKIYENGKIQQIHGFNEYRRKINVKETEFDIRLEKVIYQPRLFVLVFNLTDYFLKMDKGIDYLFEKVFRKQDRIMVLANYTFIPEKTITDLQTDKNQLKSIIKKECKTARVQVLKVFRDMDNQLQLLKNELNYGFISRTAVQVIVSFLDKYLMYFRIYKKSYLIPDLDKYYHFARYLEKVKIEKWVINFYQLERFPKLRSEGPLWKKIEQQLGWNADGKRRLKDLLRRIDIELKVSTDFPVDQITKLFLKVNTTFHSIFMKPVNIDSSEDYEYNEINTDIENSLREITKITGGALILSNNLEKSLEKITEKEDIFYLLTYEPSDKQKKNRKIKVKMKGKPYKIIYDKTVYADFFKDYLDRKEKAIPEIRIENLHYNNRIFSFNVTDFKTQNMGKENQGKVDVQIKIIDMTNTVVFNKSTVLLLKKVDNKLSIRLDELQPGDYYILVDVKDMRTDKTMSEQKKISLQ